MVDGKTYKLALLPSGVVRGKLGLIGNGVAVDPEALLAEIGRMQALGVEVTPQTLRVAETATLVLPIHRAIDAARRGCAPSRSAPLRGIGPAYEDKVGRRGLRVCDLGEPELLADKLEQLLRHHNAWFRGRALEPFALEPMLQGLLAWRRVSCPSPARSGTCWTAPMPTAGAPCSKGRRP